MHGVGIAIHKDTTILELKFDLILVRLLNRLLELLGLLVIRVLIGENANLLLARYTKQKINLL